MALETYRMYNVRMFLGCWTVSLYLLVMCYIKRVLIFSTTFVWNISHSKKNSARCCYKRTVCHDGTSPLFLSDFNQAEIFWTVFFFENTHVKFNENPCSGSRVVPVLSDGRTDRQARHE